MKVNIYIFKKNDARHSGTENTVDKVAVTPRVIGRILNGQWLT